MKKQNRWLLLLLLFISLHTLSQTPQKIKITITDKKTKEFLLGANVQWLNTVVGATSDEHGIAVLDVMDSLPKAIVVTYIGYINDTIQINYPINISIELQPEIQLGEVKIKGKRQTNFISSINPIKTEKLKRVN
jgi:hypothetical protein